MSDINEEQNPVDQVQQEIDAVQGAGTETTLTPEYMTKEQGESLRGQNDTLRGEIRGLHSRLDKGLNAIRRDAEKTASEQRMQENLNAVPEEYRESVRPILQQNAELMDRLDQQAMQTPEGAPPAQQPAQTDGSAAWEPIYRVVRDFGLDPKTPGIDYDAWREPGLSDQQRSNRFFQSLRTVVTKPAAPTAQPQQRPRQVEAPTDGAPGRGDGAGGSIDDIRDLVIQGKIPPAEGNQRAQAMGETL